MNIIDQFQGNFQFVVDILSKFLFFPVFGFPFIVFWLLVGAIFFTLKLNFVNFRLFGHAISITAGKYDNLEDKGEVSHYQALASAISGTVGLGSIAGVAIGVTVGGPGAVFWLVIAGFLSMSTKFAEVTLSMKYRHINQYGKVSGGPFYYLKEGLKEKNLPRLGKILAVIFAIFCLGGTLGGGNMMQINQTVKILTNTFEPLRDYGWVLSLLITLSIAVILIGSIKRIAVVADKMSPSMALIYVFSTLTIIAVNWHLVPDAISIIFTQAFTGDAARGGVLGAIIMGFQRAFFANEAGLGSSPIAHSAARTNEPVREGVVALLEPFISNVIICFMTGLAVTVTGAYLTGTREDGVLIVARAFDTVSPWFSVMLAISVFLFAFSTMMTWSYYGEMAWEYLFGRKSIYLYYLIFCIFAFFGGVIHFGPILDFSDMLILAMALPNLIALYILSGNIKAELDDYVIRLKSGMF